MIPNTAIPSKAPAGRRLRSGFSLVELLVASALTLVVMAALATLFGDFGRAVSDGRAMVEVNSRLRNAAWRLRQDLAGLTCVPTPLVRVESGQGYFHVIEGPLTTGDVDDVLALTTSSPGAPFTGRLAGAAGFESPVAEVVWFCEPSGLTYADNQPLYTLHRRQFLIAATPDVGDFANNVFAPKGDSDLSYGQQHANSLGDVSKPANRFWYPLPAPTLPWNRKLTGNREGEDVMLDNVIAFNIRVVAAAATTPSNQSFETRDDGDPAAEPLRGIDVVIRIVEPSNGQTRDLRVVHSFSR